MTDHYADLLDPAVRTADEQATDDQQAADAAGEEDR